MLGKLFAPKIPWVFQWYFLIIMLKWFLRLHYLRRKEEAQSLCKNDSNIFLSFQQIVSVFE